MEQKAQQQIIVAIKEEITDTTSGMSIPARNNSTHQCLTKISSKGKMH